MGFRGFRFVWESPVARISFGVGILLLVLSIAGFGVAHKHRADGKVVEGTLVKRGYPLKSDVYEVHDARTSASRATVIAFLLLLGSSAAFFTGLWPGCPAGKLSRKTPRPMSP